MPKKKSAIAIKKSAAVVPFIDRPWTDRRLVVVDRLAKNQRAIEKNAEATSRFAQKAGEWTSDTVADAISPFTAIPLLAKGIGMAAGAIVSSKLDFSSDGEYDDSVITIGREEALSIRFPPGHPQDDVVYVAHPLIAEVYYPLASFHRFLFEHKVTEAIRLLMSLGAKTMLVEHVDGWSREFAGNLSLPIPQLEGTAGLSASLKQKAESSMLFRATLKGLDNPSIPSDLLWFPHEPTWQQVAEGRIKYGLQEFSLIVSYTDDLGINADLTAKLAEMEFGIGGKFQRFKMTKWKIEGVFA